MCFILNIIPKTRLWSIITYECTDLSHPSTRILLRINHWRNICAKSVLKKHYLGKIKNYLVKNRCVLITQCTPLEPIFQPLWMYGLMKEKHTEKIREKG